MPVLFCNLIVYYSPRTQNVSFSASASFGTERSEVAKTRTRGMSHYASVVAYTIFLESKYTKILKIWNRKTLFLENVRMDVSACARLCVSVYVDISWFTRSILTRERSFFRFCFHS